MLPGCGGRWLHLRCDQTIQIAALACLLRATTGSPATTAACPRCPATCFCRAVSTFRTVRGKGFIENNPINGEPPGLDLGHRCRRGGTSRGGGWVGGCRARCQAAPAVDQIAVTVLGTTEISRQVRAGPARAAAGGCIQSSHRGRPSALAQSEPYRRTITLLPVPRNSADVLRQIAPTFDFVGSDGRNRWERPVDFGLQSEDLSQSSVAFFLVLPANTAIRFSKPTEFPHNNLNHSSLVWIAASKQPRPRGCEMTELQDREADDGWGETSSDNFKIQAKNQKEAGAKHFPIIDQFPLALGFSAPYDQSTYSNAASKVRQKMRRRSGSQEDAHEALLQLFTISSSRGANKVDQAFMSSLGGLGECKKSTVENANKAVIRPCPDRKCHKVMSGRLVDAYGNKQTPNNKQYAQCSTCDNKQYATVDISNSAYKFFYRKLQYH
eukprot:g59719.t1